MKQPKTKPKLQDESELKFFYDFLYQYENDENHKGYNSRYLNKELRSILKHKQKSIKKPNEKNIILYSGGSVVADFLRHLRNVFAHCNIESVNEKMIFVFYDEYKGKCTMYGKIDKSLFYKLMKEIEKTRRQ